MPAQWLSNTGDLSARTGAALESAIRGLAQPERARRLRQALVLLLVLLLEKLMSKWKIENPFIEKLGFETVKLAADSAKVCAHSASSAPCLTSLLLFPGPPVRVRLHVRGRERMARQESA